MDRTVDITFLGTCACDFSPLLDTVYKNIFDKDARRSSSMLIDGSMLVDCGIHTLESLSILGIEYASIGDIFITHLHDDHFNADHIAEIAKMRSVPLNLWISDSADIEPIPNVKIIKMAPCVSYFVKEGVELIGLPAIHDESSCPQHLLIKCHGKKIFYGCDGAWIQNRTYYFLHRSELDMAVLDCTVGDYEGDYRIAEHNSIPMLRAMLPSLRSFGIITDRTMVYFSHLAPSLHRPHMETVEIARPMGAQVAYDGLALQL